LALAKKLAGGLSVVSLDPIHIIGYIGALGSVLFGGNQLRLILAKGSARDVSVSDYVLRVGYSVLLGVYAVGTRDLVFTVVNFAAALLSAAVAAVSKWTKDRYDGG
jgi:hypothetical protein